jgi:nicotinamide-nucleotide amidase
MNHVAADVLARLERRGMTLAVAESLTGGLLVAEFVAVPGASAVLLGGVVAYNTALKHSLLGVDPLLLAEHGPVHSLVAEQMADGVRFAAAVDGQSADVGISTTGVAGPDPQDGHAPGTVFVGFAIGARVSCVELALTGSRTEIRAETVDRALAHLGLLLAAEFPE